MSDIQEEQKRLYKRAEENDRTDTISIQDLFDERNKNNQRISELVLQREELQDRINKAIEYINNCPEYLWANVNTKSLLNILKGDNK